MLGKWKNSPEQDQSENVNDRRLFQGSPKNFMNIHQKLFG